MTKSIQLYRADTCLGKPVLVNCPDGGWPCKDEHGNPVKEYVTHFCDEAEAWRHMLTEVAGREQEIIGNIARLETALYSERLRLAETVRSRELLEANWAAYRVGVMA